MKNYNQDTANHQSEKLQFCLEHFNKIDCLYNHLIERFSELIGDESLGELNSSIEKLVCKAKKQLELLGRIHDLLGYQPGFDRCEGLVQFLEDNFGRIQPISSIMLRKSYLLSYLYYADSVLIASFRLLQLNVETTLSKQICQLTAELATLAQKENSLLTTLK